MQYEIIKIVMAKYRFIFYLLLIASIGLALGNNAWLDIGFGNS